MVKKVSFLILFLFAGTPPAMAQAQEWQRIFDSPQLATFVILAGLFISISIWAFLERQTIARKFRKVLSAKAVGEELLDFAPAGYMVLRQGGFCYVSDRLREWLGFTTPVSHFDDLRGSTDNPGFDEESFKKLKSYIVQIARRRIPLPLKLNHTQQDEDLYVFGKPMRTDDADDQCILLWVTLGDGASMKGRTASSGTAKGGELFQTPESFDLYLEAQSETLNGLSTSVAIFGPDQTLRFCNQAFRALWSLSDNWAEIVPNHSEFLEKMRVQRRRED
jgi:hypothetical protein